MSMVLCLQTITETDVLALLADPMAVYGVVDDESDAGIDLDKSWHALHYMLTGTAWAGNEPACFLLMGGTAIGAEDPEDATARMLTSAEVQRFAEHTSQISNDELRRRYDTAAMMDAEIYPEIWDDEDEDNFEYVEQYFKELQTFLSAAAKSGSGLLISMS